MIWLTIAFDLIKKSYLGIIGIFGLFLLGRNSKLSKENEKLNNETKHSHKTIKIQNEVIDVLQNNRPADLNTNIKRMRKKQL